MAEKKFTLRLNPDYQDEKELIDFLESQSRNRRAESLRFLTKRGYKLNQAQPISNSIITQNIPVTNTQPEINNLVEEVISDEKELQEEVEKTTEKKISNPDDPLMKFKNKFSK